MSEAGFTSATVQSGRFLPAIHSLRGLAAVFIIFYHLATMLHLAPPDDFVFIRRYFGYSVHLFFVLSAFSLMHSTERRTGDTHWGYEYFIRRFFRIAPLFYCLIVVQLLRQLLQNGGIVTDIPTLIVNLTFVFGFIPSPSTGIVWGGWSIGIEMIFYALFPLLLLIVRTQSTALILTLISIVTCYSLNRIMAAMTLEKSWNYFAFAPNICFFFMGIYAYRARHLLDNTPSLQLAIPSVAVALLVSLCFLGLSEFVYDAGRFDIILWGITFTALILWQNHKPCWLLRHRCMQFLGERSFSLYLNHPVILFFMKDTLNAVYGLLSTHFGNYAFFACFLLAFAIILPISMVTYRFIELPGIELGRKIIVRNRKNVHTA